MKCSIWVDHKEKGTISCMDHIAIRVRPAPTIQMASAEAILGDAAFPAAHVERVRSYTCHERRQRAEYHSRRYLRHLSEDALRRRAGDLICNVVYVSRRNRYSVNTRYINYWRDRLAHTVEELAIRGVSTVIEEGVLGHLPPLGFSTPRELVGITSGRAFYRYDKLRYIESLQSKGEIFLRCASTVDPVLDAARSDSNEPSIRLSLLAEDLIIESDAPVYPWPGKPDVVDVAIHQKTDYLMFCLSCVYDWRLFGDFGGETAADGTEEPMACLVITDQDEFSRRFVRAATNLVPQWLDQSDEVEVNAASAHYYDPNDARECNTLFTNSGVLPFAKRRSYTYQHEYRFVIRPCLPENFVPSYSPESMPRFSRDFLHLGSLEDISTIIYSDPAQLHRSRFYLSRRESSILASAIGVTLDDSSDRVRFTYSVEMKERGRTDPVDLMTPMRYERGALQLHQQEIDITSEPSSWDVISLVASFYKVLDVREHGNHLIQFDIDGTSLSARCRYRVLLPCAEPGDDDLQVQPYSFQVRYSTRSPDGKIQCQEETITVEAETYWKQYNGVGPLHLHPTYRSLLLAEMEFLERLSARGLGGLSRYEVSHNEMGRCSEFVVDEVIRAK